MCGSCGCGSHTDNIQRFNLEVVQQLAQRAEKERAATRKLAEGRISLISAGSIPAFEVLSEDPKNRSSILIFQKLGSFGALGLEFKKFEVKAPRASVVLAFEYRSLEGAPFAVKGEIAIECDDLSNPQGANTTVDLSATDGKFKALINWNCIKQCAPQCLYCGNDWQCWLGCAGMCIIQCL